MSYRNLQACTEDLARHGHLVRLDDEVDPRLEVAEIHRRVFRGGGPAILFTRVKGCRFPLASNLFGTRERTRFLFRRTLESVQRLIRLKIDPQEALRHPLRAAGSAWSALRMLPRRARGGPVLAHEIGLADLPQVVCWPDDAGAFITLPQVYTEHPERPGLGGANLGMYRVQLSGGKYAADEVGLHYQIHRGIGVHHAAAIARGAPFRVNVFVGGAPAMTLAAVMPLPEGMSELGFAGVLSGARIPMIARAGALPIYGEADFCLVGTVIPGKLLPEGPFGDHLGYYSLAHDFPVLKVEKVYHRRGAIWPFTVVGRPPQEDTMFGELIHELTGPAIPGVLPGVKGVHAVDAAGVHPLLLAIGSERYTPYEPRRRPRELLTQASAILGQGQLSLAKYLCIVSADDDPQLDLHDIRAFFRHLLRRIDWRRDLHFHTCTNLDTLDYSGAALNEGSKVVLAAAGPVVRELGEELPSTLPLPAAFGRAQLAMPGVVVLEGPAYPAGPERCDPVLDELCRALARCGGLESLPLWVVVDDSRFAARSLENFLWVTFTRSDPATDIHGAGGRVEHKHWGCTGPLVIDGRSKGHHAPPLVEDPEVSKRVDALAARGGPLARWL